MRNGIVNDDALDSRHFLPWKTGGRPWKSVRQRLGPGNALTVNGSKTEVKTSLVFLMVQLHSSPVSLHTANVCFSIGADFGNIELAVLSLR